MAAAIWSITSGRRASEKLGMHSTSRIMRFSILDLCVVRRLKNEAIIPVCHRVLHVAPGHASLDLLQKCFVVATSVALLQHNQRLKPLLRKPHLSYARGLLLHFLGQDWISELPNTPHKEVVFKHDFVKIVGRLQVL